MATSFFQKLKDFSRDTLFRLKGFKNRVMIKLTAFLDPRLDKYRSVPFDTLSHHYHYSESQSSEEPQNPPASTEAADSPDEITPDDTPYTPATTLELVQLISRTPETVLSRRQRNTLAGLMTFDDVSIESIMTPKEEMTFLKDNDFLGPLVVDQLYKTGQIYFPVKGTEGRATDKVRGVLRTAQLDPLHISEDEPITRFLNYNLCYVRKDYSLEQTLAAMLRTGSDFALVVDRNSEIIGSLTLEAIVIMLFSRRIADDFDADADPSAVASRPDK